ncbi:hypothetical protein OSB04_004790 [Centaurea solstitialis]|uniref:Uncharacterized protein n=1 Tax=Centaurea solstitialis TaxID=347529 RepID=A0AA38TRE6_9ASTR|nr:hypothetical protein OSB04_004790 [Centaurea solstitialis]
MGNCQAIDNASLVIQHPNGKVERLYSAISATEIMKLNPGHYVALLLTTTLYSSRALPAPGTGTGSAAGKQNQPGAGGGGGSGGQPPLRVTRIKLLRPTDMLAVGHIYRLVTTKEVMKGLMAKKNGKINNNNINKFKPLEESAGNHEAKVTGINHSENTHHQMKKSDRDRRRTTAVPAKPRGWHPSLNSISEASS